MRSPSANVGLTIKTDEGADTLESVFSAMTWDDELEQLSARVYETFGEVALAEAYIRALAATPTSRAAVAQIETLLEPHVVPGECMKIVDPRALATTFRAELQRLLTPH
jgi:hypothetical protein